MMIDQTILSQDEVIANAFTGHIRMLRNGLLEIIEFFVLVCLVVCKVIHAVICIGYGLIGLCLWMTGIWIHCLQNLRKRMEELQDEPIRS